MYGLDLAFICNWKHMLPRSLLHWQWCFTDFSGRYNGPLTTRPSWHPVALTEGSTCGIWGRIQPLTGSVLKYWNLFFSISSEKHEYQVLLTWMEEALVSWWGNLNMTWRLPFSISMYLWCFFRCTHCSYLNSSVILLNETSIWPPRATPDWRHDMGLWMMWCNVWVVICVLQ